MSNPHKLGLTIFLCLVGVAITGWIALSQGERGTDFNQFYSAGRLVGTGDLYNWQRMQTLELRHHTELVPFGRLPFYAGLFKILALLPYSVARLVWAVVTVACLVLFAVLWPGPREETMAVLCWSVPAAILVALGQDTALFLFWSILSFRLLQSHHDFSAGLTWSLCAAKFHLALGIPIFLLAQKRWGAIAGGILGATAQLAISFALEGWAWPARLIHLSSLSRFSPAEAKMPNLLGLTHWLPHGLALEALLAVASLASVWLISKRGSTLEGVAAAIVAGLLVGHHAYVYDTVLLLPAILLVRHRFADGPFHYWALLLCTPLPYLLMMIDRTALFSQALITCFEVSFLCWLTLGRTSANYRYMSGGRPQNSLETVCMMLPNAE